MQLIRADKAELPNGTTIDSFEVHTGEKVGLYHHESQTLSSFMAVLDINGAPQNQAYVECHFEADECRFPWAQRLDQTMDVKGWMQNEVKGLFHCLDHYERLNIRITKTMSPSDMPAVLEQIEEMEQKLNEWDAWDIETEIDQWIEWLQLSPQAAIADLKVPEQQRLAHIGALLRPPKVLLLDRPFDWFDRRETELLIAHIQKWAQTLVISSHDEPLLDQVVNRKVRLADQD